MGNKSDLLSNKSAVLIKNRCTTTKFHRTISKDGSVWSKHRVLQWILQTYRLFDETIVTLSVSGWRKRRTDGYSTHDLTLSLKVSWTDESSLNRLPVKRWSWMKKCGRNVVNTFSTCRHVEQFSQDTVSGSTPIRCCTMTKRLGHPIHSALFSLESVCCLPVIYPLNQAVISEDCH